MGEPVKEHGTNKPPRLEEIWEGQGDTMWSCVLSPTTSTNHDGTPSWPTIHAHPLSHRTRDCKHRDGAASLGSLTPCSLPRRCPIKRHALSACAFSDVHFWVLDSPLGPWKGLPGCSSKFLDHMVILLSIFLRDLSTVSHIGYASWHFHQQCRRVPLLCILFNTYFLVFLITAILNAEGDISLWFWFYFPDD